VAIKRRVARLERQRRGVGAGGPPTCVVYLPYDSRGDIGPVPKVSRSRASPVVTYDPDAGCPTVEELDNWPA
jgi:hypothetical protein